MTHEPVELVYGIRRHAHPIGGIEGRMIAQYCVIVASPGVVYRA